MIGLAHLDTVQDAGRRSDPAELDSLLHGP